MKFIYFVLHFRNHLLTEKSVASIEKGLRWSDALVVIDASHDLCFEKLSFSQSRRVVRTERFNPGFARAMNEVVLKTDACKRFDVIVFVNNDAEIPADFGAEVARVFKAFPSAAVVGPKIVYKSDPDYIWSAGGSIDIFKMKAVQMYNQEKASAVSGSFRVDFASGCVLAILANDFADVGLWPDCYLFGGEEWELSTRLRRSGKEIIINGELVVYHDASFTSGQGRSHTFRDLKFILNSYMNRLLFSGRMYGSLVREVFRVFIVIYLRIVMPLRWKQIGSAKVLREKFYIANRIADVIWGWRGDRVLSFAFLQKQADGVVEKFSRYTKRR